ncbi:MAG TPA: hypothetical protein VEV17_08895 [Bryobacteraceae bacterium]|nr:hypothetical protein [Bryobacteraceae bacterium]
MATRSTLNLANAASPAPSGIVQSCSDNPGNNRVDCVSSYNSAFIATHDTVHANENYCYSTNGTTAYTCSLPFKVLTAYQTGMTFLLFTDQTCASSCTLKIDTLQTVNLKRVDGTTDPGGMLTAFQPQWIFYDGRVFRLMGVGGGPPSAAAPVDSRRDVMARRVIGSMDTMPYAATIDLDVTAGDLHKTSTANSAGNATIHATTGGLPGQHMWIIVANDSISGKAITFGRNFKASGALVGTPGKSATLQFVSDGTAWYEIARTLNL